MNDPKLLVPNGEASPAKREFKHYRVEVLPMGNDTMQGYLDKLWEEGWEVVTFACVPCKRSKFDPGPDVPGMMVAFKRRVMVAAA